MHPTEQFHTFKTTGLQKGGLYNILQKGGLYNILQKGGLYNILQKVGLYNILQKGGVYNILQKGGLYNINFQYMQSDPDDSTKKYVKWFFLRWIRRGELWPFHTEH